MGHVEYRVWNEKGDALAWATVKSTGEGGWYEVELYPHGSYEKTVPAKGHEFAEFSAKTLAETWREREVHAAMDAHGISEREAEGEITIQRVSEDWD